MIFQDGIRGNRWYVHQLIDTLTTGGSQPMLKILPGVSALFFTEDDQQANIADLKHGLAVQRIVRETADHLKTFRQNFKNGQA